MSKCNPLLVALPIKEEESAVVANISMRGIPADSPKTLILEDGVPVAPGLFVGNGRYYNPRIQHIESIEVLKGASSLRYGDRNSTRMNSCHVKCSYSE